MSEAFLANDRRGNLIQGCSVDKFFFMGAKIINHAAIRAMDLPIPLKPSCCYDAINFILAKSFTSE